MNPNKFIDNLDNTIDRRLPQSPEATEKRKKRILRPLAGIAAIGALVATLGVIKEANELPTFSETTASYVVQPGEGISNAAIEIENVGTINIQDADSYIENMPENAKVLKDGLQAYEQLTIPKSVEKP